MKLKLTDESIQADIEAYKVRKQAAIDALELLPAVSSAPFKKRSAVKTKRRGLQAEVILVNGLIKIASEALREEAI